MTPASEMEWTSEESWRMVGWPSNLEVALDPAKLVSGEFGMERRLSAIFVADMVGYSRLMELDELDTIQRQKQHRDKLIDPAFERHQGRIIKTTGDGLLAEFPSVVEAVGCAVEIQRAMIEREAETLENRRIQYRVGINLGDVVHEDGDIHGDGVNIAARLEQMADIGGVCISGTAYDQLRASVEAGYEDLGEVHVKNIERPIRAWRVLLDPNRVGEVVSTPSAKRGLLTVLVAVLIVLVLVTGGNWWWQQAEFTPAQTEKSSLDPTNKPSVAVLPFINISGDREQDYFVDGMTEDLITDLSKISALTVISRTSTFAYKGKSPDIRDVARDLGVLFVVEGSARKFGDKIRLTAQLIEASTGEHLWAERYDRDFSEVFAVQDEVRSKIVSVLAVKLTSSEETRLEHPLTVSTKAYDFYLRGVQLEGFFSRDSNLESIDRFKQAIALDPNFSASYARLAQAYSFAVEYDWTEDHENYIRLALSNAKTAIELDNELPYAHWSLGRIYTRIFSSDLEKAIASFEKSIELNSNYADAYIFLAYAHMFSGHAEKALPLIETGMSMNPHTPFAYHQALGMARMFLGNCEAAVHSFNQALEQNPTASFMQRYLIACYGYLGQQDDAEWAAIEFETLGRSATIKALMDSSSIRDPAYRKIFEDGLRKADLPEE